MTSAKSELPDKDRVWNRACAADWPPVFDEKVPEGDRRLAYMVAFDSYAQGDGLMDAMSHCGSEGTRQAIAAFRWFGIPKLADVVQKTWDQLLPPDTEWSDDADLDFDVLNIESMTERQAEALEKKQQKFEEQYYAAAENLNEKFEEFYQAHPELFAPPGD